MFYYIFASLFWMAKGEHFWNKKRCFLFHFKTSFCSWDNQILIFQIFKCHNVIKWLSMKHETHHHFANLCNITKEIFLSKTFYEKYGLKTSYRPFFNFQRILCKNDSEEVCVLIWTNFDSFANLYLIQVASFNSFIFQ